MWYTMMHDAGYFSYLMPLKLQTYMKLQTCMHTHAGNMGLGWGAIHAIPRCSVAEESRFNSGASDNGRELRREWELNEHHGLQVLARTPVLSQAVLQERHKLPARCGNDQCQTCLCV